MRAVVFLLMLMLAVLAAAQNSTSAPTPAPTLPPVPPGATKEPTFAPVTLTVITQQGSTETVTVGLVVGLAAVGIIGLTVVGVVMVNYYSTDEDMGVADDQLIDVDKLRADLAMYKELAASGQGLERRPLVRR